MAEIKQNLGIVVPMVSDIQFSQAWGEFQKLKKALIEENDIQLIEGKSFLKKSFWRKVSTCFNLNIEIEKEEKEIIGSTIAWHFTVRATAPNGRYTTGVGSCDAYEHARLLKGAYVTLDKRTGSYTPAIPKSIHNIRSTAETRAVNRAISNLVGSGEVSAEEAEQGVLHVEVTSTNIDTNVNTKPKLSTNS